MPSIPEEPEQGELERLSMPDFLRPLQDLDVGLAKEAMLECQVTGLPYPTISWFHNGHRIQSSDDRRMTQCTCVGRDPEGCPLQHPLCLHPLCPPSGLPFLAWSGKGPGGGEPRGPRSLPSPSSLLGTHQMGHHSGPWWPVSTCRTSSAAATDCGHVTEPLWASVSSSVVGLP